MTEKEAIMILKEMLDQVSAQTEEPTNLQICVQAVGAWYYCGLLPDNPECVYSHSPYKIETAAEFWAFLKTTIINQVAVIADYDEPVSFGHYAYPQYQGTRVGARSGKQYVLQHPIP